MKTLSAKFKRVGRQIKGLFPSPLPTGMEEFQVWAKDIASTYTLPTVDERSIIFALSTMIMHLGPSIASKSKYSFARDLRASAAKQIAGATFQELKLKHQEETRAKSVEATVL